MMPHIAYVTGEYPRATDTFVQREVSELRKLGLEVTTVSIRRTSAEHHVGPEQKAEAANTHCLLPPNLITLLAAHAGALLRSPARYFASIREAWRTRQPGLKGTLYQTFYFAEAGLVVRILRRHDCDHLHNHFANSSCSVAMLASVMGGIPFSFTMHGPAIFFEPMLWRIDRKIARAKFVACISHFCRSQGMTFSPPEQWHKLRIVHCGVDLTQFESRNHKGRGTRLTYVGRLAAVKGLPVLLDALATLPEDVGLTVVGDGLDRKMLEQQTSDLGLDRRVEFVGYQSQSSVRDILAGTDVFVMASFAEGVPVVLMEAMAAGVPVVATRIAGVGELVEDGVGGFLVPPGDAASLSRKLAELIDDPALRQRIGLAGREKVAADFDIRREARWLYELLTEQAGPALRNETRLDPSDEPHSVSTTKMTPSSQTVS